MSTNEFKLRKLLEDSTFFIRNSQEDETFIERCRECMDQADQLVRLNTRESFVELSAEVLVMFCEVALLINTPQRDADSQRVLDIFFQRFTQEDQFYCRALLAYATCEERKIVQQSLKGEDNLKQVLNAFSYVRRAIDIAVRPENKLKYQFVVYNASIKTWHIIRPLMKPQWAKNLVEILERISNLLEEADDSDFNWRCRYLNALTKAMLDAEKKPEALKILDKLWELTKKKGECKFQETLFRNRVHLYRDNAGILGNLKKETETGQDPNGFKSLLVIQSIKSGIIPEAQVEKELTAIMSALSPSSINQDPAQAQASSKLSPLAQDRLAECGRLAIRYNLVQLCEGACNVVARARQGSLRAKVWCEYSKAELLLRKPMSEVDKKTGMKLNTFQKQLEDFERRVEALKVLDRVMIANKRLGDADVITEGCLLIWNLSLPLLKKSSRSQLAKPFLAAIQALEAIGSNETVLRVSLHLELAKYEIERDYLQNAMSQLKKALDLDYSLTLKQIPGDLKDDDDPGDFQRPYQKLLKFLLQKLSLKTNLYGGDPDNVQDQIIIDVENAKTTKNVRMRETLLAKALKDLQEFEEPEFDPETMPNMVEEELKVAQRKFHLAKVRAKKDRVLIAAEISKLAMEEGLIEVAREAAELATQENWEAQKNGELVIAQSEAQFILAGVYVEYLLEEEIEIGYKDLVTLEEDQEDRDFTNEDRARFLQWKISFTKHIINGVKLAHQAQQTWLIFNGAISFWNNYLPLFKKPNYYELILSEGVPCMIECFEGMNNCFINASFSSENVDYELDKKMQVFSNLSMMLSRLYEFLGKNDDAVRVCDTLLQKQLPSHLRKTFDSIKARVTKSVSNLGAMGQAKGGAPAKGQPVAQVASYQPSKVEITTSEVLSYLELVQNGNKDMIQKAMDSLNMWTPNSAEEIELELNAELWCRLGRLSLNVNTNQYIKIGLFSAEACLKNSDDKYKNKQFSAIPTTRLRWYSVAESLYGEALYKLLDTQKQEKDSQDKLLLLSVSHFVESCMIASKATIGYLVLESAKLMWNALLPLLDQPNNRKQLVKPLSSVHSYLKAVHENSDPDFLVLLYSALFTCIQEQKDWKLGENIVEDAFLYLPNTHQKVLWEAKMLFLSKLGKNVLNAISNMKESNASLMAKVWVKLARSSANSLEQHSAYNKAIEILRKEESVEVVEVLIEYAEWLQRSKYSTQDVEDQLLLAVDILMDIEPGWDDEDEEAVDENGNEDEAKTRKTRQSKGSRMSKNSLAKTKASKAGGKSNMKSKFGGAQSKKSRASKRSAAMRSSAGSRNSKKTTTALSKRQEEDSQPQFLNCSHFEKLVRIHSMLSMIAPDSYKQREYALDAHFFVMKMWEQSYQTLNAIQFFEEHKTEVEELGYVQNNVESRRQYFFELFTNNEIGIPVKHALPEKPEDWLLYATPEPLVAKAKGHEDKLMVSKWTFIKPELTFFHLQNIATVLEDHYFSIQLVPIIEMLKLFGKVVLEDRKIEEVTLMRKARLLFNLGLRPEGEALKTQVENEGYKITEEEKKTQLEKIKALKDPSDNLKDKGVIFHFEEEFEPVILESLRIHEIWILYAEELMKWGEFVRAKEFVLEVNIHSRILKDQELFSQSLMMLSSIAFLEGESASALRLDMMCHQYAKAMRTVESGIEHCFDLLNHFKKFDDCVTLVNGSLEMLINLSEKQQSLSTQTQGNATKYSGQNNLSLDYAMGTVYILKAILSLKESQGIKSLDDQESKMEESFSYIEKYEILIQRAGYKESQLIRLLEYSQILQEESLKAVEADLKQVELIKSKLERNARILLRVQELLTNQVYYVGVHQDSQSRISLPLVRLLGIVKLRIAQVNTQIGIVKNSIRTSSSTAMDPDKKMDKVVATFMDAVTKQIEAQTNTYKQKMNRYEKSISILYSALNMINSGCAEYSEALVEIAKCRRLLAVNKKHLRGQWRQDAIEVDRVNLKQIQIDEERDRKEQLEEKGLQGEVKDIFVDYKEEALKTFVDLLENKTEVKLIDKIGSTTFENVLATFALEYAECRGNLNKEQAFFYLALYQFAVSRQYLLQVYLKATNEKHPDILRLRHLSFIKQQFSQFSTPNLPKTYLKTEEDLKEQSKPYKILSHFAPIEELKEALPHSSAYLIVQLSEDRQQLYYGIMQINKERKFTYFVSKMTLSDLMRDKLDSMVHQLGQNKLAMQKTPITIEEDLINLERDAEEEMHKILGDLEMFFEAMSTSLEGVINPILKTQEEEEMQPPAGAKGAPPKKDDKKQPPPKQPAGKPAGKGAPGELATYESNLPLPTSGIESLILLIDHRIESLPFETLKVFSKVPVLSRDFNLHLYSYRLKTIGHQAPIHNNLGIQKESLRFIIDAPQPLEEKTQQFTTGELPKMMANSKWDGLLTKQHHIPSEGEWQRLISGASLFAYYSMTSIIHKFPPMLVSDLSIFSKCKAMIIIDRMNTYKTLIDRNILTSQFYQPNEQPTQAVALYSLCGIASIVTNHWPIKPEVNFEIFQNIMKGTLSEGVYLGAALRKYKDESLPSAHERKAIYKYNTVNYGVPIMRIV